MDGQKKRALRWVYKKVDTILDEGLKRWWIALMREAARKALENRNRQKLSNRQ